MQLQSQGRAKFFQDVIDTIDKNTAKSAPESCSLLQVLLGDFNAVIDPKIDRFATDDTQ